MSDIDFDELDRAVNGALNNTPTPQPVADNTAPAPVTPPVVEPVERTSLSSVAPTSKPTAPVAPAARRSSGRFMDMVHPSSDMRSRTDEPSVTSPLSTPSVVAPAPAVVSQPVVTAPEIIETPAWNEPLESPFLPDAKVEKRPLGGGDTQAPNESEAIPSGFDFQGLLDEPDEELLEAPEPQERLEATTLPDPIDFAAAQAPVVITPIVQEPVKEAPARPEVNPAPLRAPEPAPQPVAEEPIGPTSITPQYKEQPSSNQESGAIFDTESYHQPVVQPAKKKSGWLTVLWILLLVALGAGGGWAIYTYVLPML